MSVMALPLAVGHLHQLHRLPVLDVFCLLGLSERAYKDQTVLFPLLLPFSFLSMLYFLIDGYIVV